MVSVPGFYTKKGAKSAAERFPGPTHHSPAIVESNQPETATQPEMEGIEPGKTRNPQDQDTFLAGKSTNDLPHSHLDFMHKFTDGNSFQKVINDIDCDLSKFELPLTDNNSHSTLPQNNSPPTSHHTISATHHPIIQPKCSTMPLTPPNSFSAAAIKNSEPERYYQQSIATETGPRSSAPGVARQDY